MPSSGLERNVAQSAGHSKGEVLEALRLSAHECQERVVYGFLDRTLSTEVRFLKLLDYRRMNVERVLA